MTKFIANWDMGQILFVSVVFVQLGLACRVVWIWTLIDYSQDVLVGVDASRPRDPHCFWLLHPLLIGWILLLATILTVTALLFTNFTLKKKEMENSKDSNFKTPANQFVPKQRPNAPMHDRYRDPMFPNHSCDSDTPNRSGRRHMENEEANVRNTRKARRERRRKRRYAVPSSVFDFEDEPEDMYWEEDIADTFWRREETCREEPHTCPPRSAPQHAQHQQTPRIFLLEPRLLQPNNSPASTSSKSSDNNSNVSTQACENNGDGRVVQQTIEELDEGSNRRKTMRGPCSPYRCLPKIVDWRVYHEESLF